MNTQHYSYQQTEPRVVYTYALGLGLASLLVWLIWGAEVSSPVFSFGGLYLMVARAPFMSLITQLDNESLTVQYWLGVPRKQIQIDRIVSAEPAANPRWTRRGGPQRIWSERLWSFGVWGVEAVEVRFRDDEGANAAFRIATDDVEGLLAALERR